MDAVTQDVVDAFGSLSKPHWAIVSQRYHEGWYDDVYRDLGETAEVIETTDLNDDNSRCWSVGDATDSFGLRLSLVGRYACVQKRDGSIGTPLSLGSSGLGQRILDLLASRGIVLLSGDALGNRIDFDGQLLTWFEVLFSREAIPT